MKITVILRKDSDVIKGEMIAAHNRAKEIIKNFPEAEINLVVIREYIHPLLQRLRNCPVVKKKAYLDYDGLRYKAKWFNFSIIDNLLGKLHKNPYFIYKQLENICDEIAESDIVVAHSLYAGYIAMQAKIKYNIPYTVTWHGSDIHTIPQNNPYLREKTIRIIKNASANHFVSKDLLLKSDDLCLTNNKSVLYNGVDRSQFYKYSTKDKERYQREYDIKPGTKNIAFLGNFYQVKNVLSLPLIFGKIHKHLNATFHFVGDGTLRNILENSCIENNIDYRIWGFQPSDKMPSIINCMDMVVLPSFNEGLPLVTLESLACGVPVVGSRVGGIPEAIGIENTIPIDENFTTNMANLIEKKFESDDIVQVGNEFSWEYTGRLEKDIIYSILS